MRILKIFAAFLLFTTSFSIAGIAQTPVPYLTEPAISPDRSEVAFVSGGDIWTVPIKGGIARILVSHPATEGRPVYSPDGNQLAFVSNRTGNGDIYVLDLASNLVRRVTFNDTSDNLDAWSADGKWLYFYSSNQDISGMNDIFRVRASGGTPLAVSADRYTNEFFSAPSPDGRAVAFSARGISHSQWWRKGRSHIDETELWILENGSYRRVEAGGAKQHRPMWDPKGKKIYFVSDRGGPQNIWSKRLNGRARRMTDFSDGRDLWPHISYDGKLIVFERNFEIWSMKTGNGKAARIPIVLRGNSADQQETTVDLSGKISEFSLSPDGKKIVLIARGEVFAATAGEGGEAFRVTKTAAAESFAAWSSDSKRVAYASERNGKYQIFEYDFAGGKERKLTSAGNDYSPVYSSDGKYIAFIRDAREIWLKDLKSNAERKAADLYTDLPPLIGKRTFAFSPDNKWLAFLTLRPGNRSYTNVSVVPVAGGAAKPLSFIANSFSGTVSWSPKGEYILFDTTQRTETPSLARVDLRLRTPRFNEDKFRGLFKQENPKEKPKPDTTAPSPDPPKPEASPSPERKKKVSVQIAFEGIGRRLSLVPTGVSINEHVISPDGKTLLVTASAEGRFNLYTISLDELSRNRSAKQITSTPNFKSDAQFSPDGKTAFFLERGRVVTVGLANRRVKPVAIRISAKISFAKDKIEIFRQGWRYLRDHFFDPGFHGNDWNAVYRTYEPLIAGSKNMDEMRRLMNLMVGELNASHLGVGGRSAFRGAPVGRLGLRFDRVEYENTGRLRITEVITLGPADVSKKINVGDYLLSVGGSPVTANSNLAELLENKVGKRVELVIGNSKDISKTSEVIVKPVSTRAAKSLLYRQWVKSNRAYVRKASGGRLGYVHLPNMSSGALSQLYLDLDVGNQSKDGVVIDIRNNNGGFINPYVIDVLARRGYLTMQERGLWKVPARNNLGQRALELPTILVTNQHSLSDAEDLTEGYRALGLGKVVGEPTAGWIIFTWSPSLFDGTRFRLPRARITGADGKDMELHPRKVDIAVTRPIGETLTERDRQLDAAVNELLREIGRR